MKQVSSLNLWNSVVRGHTVGSEKIYAKGFLDYQNDIKKHWILLII